MAVNVIVLGGMYIHLARYISCLKIEINKIQNTCFIAHVFKD